MKGTLRNCEDFAIHFLCMLHFYVYMEDVSLSGNGAWVADRPNAFFENAHLPTLDTRVIAPRLLV
jgi:hypothetical protein